MKLHEISHVRSKLGEKIAHIPNKNLIKKGRTQNSETHDRGIIDIIKGYLFNHIAVYLKGKSLFFSFCQ